MLPGPSGIAADLFLQEPVLQKGFWKLRPIPVEKRFTRRAELWYTFLMEKREYYYVSRKNAFTWISAILMLFSAVARIALFCGRGVALGADSSAVMWFQIFLPAFACLLFVALILFSGETHFYRTAIPIWLFAISFAHVALTRIPYLRYVVLLWALYAAAAIGYTLITAGRFKCFWILWFASAALAAGLVYEKRAAVLSLGRLDFMDWCYTLQNILGALALLAATLAINGRPEGYHYCPTWGDRPDGRRVRTIPAMSYVIPYIMPQRAAASNWIHDTVDLGPVERFINEKRAQGLTGFGIIHVFLAAYCRVAARYPAINRFCSGQHVFSRGRNLEFVMAVKVKMTADAPDTMIKVHFDPADTAEDVYHKLNEKILSVKDAPLVSDFDKTAKILTYFPGLVFTLVVRLLKIADYFGLLPTALLEISPFHGSVILTSMASLGIPPIVHHLYDFGNLPVFLALGQKYRRNEILSDGTVVQKKYVDFTVNTDERICDGFYFASCLKYLRKLLAHPERLDQPPEEIMEDIP